MRQQEVTGEVAKIPAPPLDRSRPNKPQLLRLHGRTSLVSLQTDSSNAVATGDSHMGTMVRIDMSDHMSVMRRGDDL